MKIKEQNDNHLVIVPNLGDNLGSMFVYIIFIALIIAAPFIANMWLKVSFIVVSILVLGLLFVRGIVRNIVIDKYTKNITIERRHIVFIPRRRAINFSDVQFVVTDYIPPIGTSAPEWRVSIKTTGDLLQIDRNSNREEMVYLADSISKYIGSEFVNNSNPLGTTGRISKRI